MRTRDHRTTRTLATGLFVVAGLGLAGCGTEGPEAGTDVEDVTDGQVAETSAPAADGAATEERVDDDVAEEIADAGAAGGNAGAFAFDGEYNQAFYDEIDTYVGEQVTLSAEVSQTISPDAFAIAGAVDPLLVVEEQEIPTLDEGAVVQVTGTVQEDFTIADVEEQLGIDLPDEDLADFEGQPYISATSAEVTEQG